jgi:addiction module HigA family antidote
MATTAATRPRRGRGRPAVGSESDQVGRTMGKKYQRFSKTSFPPGDEIRDAIKARGWSQEEFAARIGCHVQEVNRILTGRRSITLRTARKLERELGKSAEYWMNLSPRKNGPRPQNVKHKPCEMDEFRERIIEYYKNDGCTRPLLTMVRRVIRIAIEDAGITKLSQLNLKGYKRFEKALNETLADLSPKSRDTFLGGFQMICNRGAKMRLIPPIPFPRGRDTDRVPRVTKTSIPSQDDMKRLLNYLYKGSRTWEGQRLYTLVTLLLFTGLQKEEAIRFLVEDVDVEHHTIRWRRRRKPIWGDDPYRLPLRAEVMAVLVSWMPRTKCRWLFPGQMLVGPWNSSSGNPKSRGPLQQLQAAGAAVGIPELTFVKIRRFYLRHTRPSYGDELDSAVKSPGQPCVEIRKGKAFIRGKSKGVLSEGELLAVKALHDAYPGRLTWKVLAAKSRRPSVRRIVIDLRLKDADWRDAIDLNGQSFPGSGGSIGIQPW